MKAHKEKVSILAILLLLISICIPLKAYASDDFDIYDMGNIPGFSYDSAFNITLDVITQNTTQTIKLELFVSKGYDIEENSVLFNGIKLSTNIYGDIKYGGMVPIEDKKINCYIFYIPNTKTNNEMFVHWTSELKELIVVTALTEKDYSTQETVTLTPPERIWTYLINNTSYLEYTKNTLKEIVNYNVVNYKPYEEPIVREDHTIEYLIYAIAGTILLIIGTIVYIILTGKKKEEKRHQEFLTKMDSKEEIRKKKELESLKKYFNEETEGDSNEENRKEEENKVDREKAADRENAKSEQNGGDDKDSSENEANAKNTDESRQDEQKTLLNNTTAVKNPASINPTSVQNAPKKTKKPVKKAAPKFLEEIIPESDIDIAAHKKSNKPAKPKFLEDMKL